MATYIFKCPKCGETIKGDDAYCDMEADCPHCGNAIVIPKRLKIVLVKRRESSNKLFNHRRMVGVMQNKLTSLWKNNLKGKIILCSFPLLFLCLTFIAFALIGNIGRTETEKNSDEQLNQKTAYEESKHKARNSEQGSFMSQDHVTKPTKEFIGVLHAVDVEANAVILLDIEKWCLQRKVRFDGINLKQNRNVRQYIQNRWGGGKVRVTYKDIENGFIKGTIWAGAASGKSENEILADEGYASYVN